MSFVDTVRRARQLVQQEGRLSSRALQREFSLDAETLEAVVAELVEVQHVAVREDQTIIWVKPPEPMGASGIGPSGAPALPPTRSAEIGERRQLTVMFADLVGSTEIAARLDPEDWREIAAEYQRKAAEAVARFGGYVAKFLGDGVVCFFGWPQAHEDDAERAVRAGLAIVDGVKGLGVTGLEKTDPLTPNPLTPNPVTPNPLSVRVGIHTGPVVVGTGGGDAPDVFGDTPNVTARLQAVAAPDTVVISSATLGLVRGIFVIEELGAQSLKGVPDAVVLYRAVQPSGMRSRLDIAAGKLTPFVGRQTELATLLDGWEQMLDGAGQTVLVFGEPGVGKSRLAFQLRERLAASPHTWLECRCNPYTAGTAFHPVIELLEQGLVFTPEDTPVEKLAKLERALGWANLPAPETAPLLAEFLSLPAAAGYAPLDITPELKRRKMLDSLMAWSLKLGELQPVLILLEDLHWCDPSSLELFGRLVEQSATTRMLMVCTARPEFASPWPVRSNLKTLTLARLSKRQAREMVTSLGAAPALPDAVIERIVVQADGVPLYIEELTRMVLESGILADRAGRNEPSASIEALAIPTTLKDSLMARLDRLGPAKEVAQRAAVLGREFSYELLEAISSDDASSLQSSLGRLADAELLYQQGTPPHASYVFKHALIQMTAYESLLRKTRQTLHAEVARALEARFPERAASSPDVVARHFDEAGLVSEAISYYQRAGQRATQRSAYSEAIAHLKRGIELVKLLPETPERNRLELLLLVDLGAPITAAKGYADPELMETYSRARDLSEATTEDAELVRAVRGLSAAHWLRGELPAAVELARHALAVAERIDDRFSRVISHVILGQPLWGLGRFSEALEQFEQVIALYDPAEHRSLGHITGFDEGTIGTAFSGWCLWPLGYAEQSIDRGRRAIALAREVTHQLAHTHALTAMALTFRWRRERELARKYAAEALAIALELGSPFHIGLASIFHGWALAASPDASAGVDEIERTLVELAGIGAAAGAPFYLGILADAQWAVGRGEDALRTLELAFAVGADKPQPFADSDMLRLKGDILVQGGDVGAEDCFRRALDVARLQQAKSFELRAATSLARLLRDQGKPAAARAELAPVYGWFTEGFDTQDLKDAKGLLAELGS